MSDRLLLRGLRLAGPGPEEADRFPFNVPAVRRLEALTFTSPVTFFVGENGSGKSTLLEALALAVGLPAAGAAPLGEDPTLAPQRRLARTLRLTWSRRATRGFFLRAEDFLGFSRRLRGIRGEMEERLREVDADPAMEGASEWARGLAKGPAQASLRGMEIRYGPDLDARSHGESFLTFFRSRLVPGGLYLLDEPEAALSPQSQLGLIALIKDVVDQGSQFVAASHSPILLAVPGAELVSFDEAPPRAIPWEASENVRLYRAFLDAPERYLRHLWKLDDKGGERAGR